MKKVPCLSKLAVAALIAASPVAATAQTVSGRVAVPGISGGIVPTLGGLSAPMLSAPLMPSALALTPTLAAPSIAPAITPAIVPVAAVRGKIVSS